MRPIDIPTTETVQFIQRHINPGSQILEVGCGDGEVALALSHNGYDVTALDSEPERVRKARELGVRSFVASWPDFDIVPVDAIVFARSLHHMNPLSDAIARVGTLLKPDGLLLIEDFAVEAINEQTLNWLRQCLRSEPFTSVIYPEPESFVSDLLVADNIVRLWHDHHAAHGVHPFGLIHQLVVDRFWHCHLQSVPYLYRYLINAVPDTDRSAHLVREFLLKEIAALRQEAIAFIGRRVVAHE